MKNIMEKSPWISDLQVSGSEIIIYNHKWVTSGCFVHDLDKDGGRSENDSVITKDQITHSRMHTRSESQTDSAFPCVFLFCILYLR